MSERRICGETACQSCVANHLSLCKVLDRCGLERFWSLAKPVHFRPRAIIAKRGQELTTLFMITDGVARLFRLLPDGRRQVCGFLTAGDICGLPRVSKEACCTVQAVTAIDAYTFQHVEFLDFLAAHQELSVRMLVLAAGEVEAQHDQLVMLGRKRSDERLAWFLLMMNSKLTAAGEHAGQEFRLPMTRSDIADYLGLTVETVSRTLADFRESGLIETGKSGAMTLCKPAALNFVAGVGDYSYCAQRLLGM